MTYDYTSKYDMVRLAYAVRTMNLHKFMEIAPAIYAADLMRVNFWIRWSIRLIMWRRKWTKLQAYTHLGRYVPGIYYGLQTALADHIVKGKDLYDPKSAGGLCEAEVMVLVELMNSGVTDVDYQAA